MYNPTHPQDSQFRFPPQCYFLKFNGFWPVSPNHNQSKFVYGFLYTLLSWAAILDVVFILFCAVSYIISVLGDLVKLIEVLCSSLMGFLMLSRMLHLQFSQDKIRQVMALFVQDIWIVKGSYPCIEDECRRRMKPYLVMSSLMFGLVFMYASVSLIVAYHLGWESQEKPFPYRMLFFYDAQRKWPYIVTYIVAVLSAVIGGTTLVAEDSLIGFVITYTCGQYQILHECIDKLTHKAGQITRKHGLLKEDSLQNEYLKELNAIACKHNKLIEFIKLLEKTVSLTILVNFFFSTVLLCLVGFQLATVKDMIMGDYAKFLVYICQTLSQLYLMCWNGDRLIQMSSKTTEHLYACNWEGSQHGTPASKQFRQHLQIMMMCSQRPVQVTAGKFATISFPSFLMVLRASMSYFTVLQTMYREGDS